MVADRHQDRLSYPPDTLLAWLGLRSDAQGITDMFNQMEEDDE